MSPPLLVVVPVLAGTGLALARTRSRSVLGAVAVSATGVTAALAAWAAVAQPVNALAWGGGIDLVLEVSDVARAPVVLVPVVAAAIVAYAAAHEHVDGLARMLGLLVAFVGAMELLLVAGDLLSLLIGWELVGALSWALIAHEWRTSAPSGAAGAFLTTRFGDLGLFIAAGAAFAGTGSFAFDRLAGADGAMTDVLVAGVVLAAVAKSAQVPFASWLFSAMVGPTPASALLHSATMVAAGAYLLARLQPVLDTVSWFAPTILTVGLVTALTGGVVAALQPDAKKLLAASTSAHYGLMLVAVGAGYPAVATAHLVAHAAFKALLFLSAGVAISASGRRELSGMGLGPRRRTVAWLTGIGTVALAGVPPLGAAWTKEEVLAAAAHVAPWLGALVALAGGLSAFYAARFQLLAYGPPRERRHPPGTRPVTAAAPDTADDAWLHGPGRIEQAAIGLLAAISVGLSVLWLPVGERALIAVTGGVLPTGAAWELAASLSAVAVGVYAAVTLASRRRLAHLAVSSRSRAVADWFLMPVLTRRVIVAPTLALASAAARFDDAVVDGGVRVAAATGRRAADVLARGDDRVVDAGVRGIAALGGLTARVLDRIAEVGIDGAVEGLARLIGVAGHDSRRAQTGQTHVYYAFIAVGTAVLVALTAVWSR